MNKTAVLLTHYNSPEDLYSVLRTIDQSEKIDLIIVDDGSNDFFDEEIVKQSFGAKGLIHFIYSKKNGGVPIATNIGLRYLKEKGYSYIARLDCGDKVIGRRFKIQEEFLDTNPDIGLVGSYTRFSTTTGEHIYDLCPKTEAHDINKHMHVTVQFIHPTIVFRTSVLDVAGMYPEKYIVGSDYAFLFNVTKKIKTANLPQFLMDCEVNPNGISGIKRTQQIKNRFKIFNEHFYFGIWPIYGFIRNFLTYIIPRNMLNFLKKFIKP